MQPDTMLFSKYDFIDLKPDVSSVLFIGFIGIRSRRIFQWMVWDETAFRVFRCCWENQYW